MKYSSERTAKEQTTKETRPGHKTREAKLRKPSEVH